MLCKPFILPQETDQNTLSLRWIELLLRCHNCISSRFCHKVADLLIILNKFLENLLQLVRLFRGQFHFNCCNITLPHFKQAVG